MEGGVQDHDRTYSERHPMSPGTSWFQSRESLLSGVTRNRIQFPNTPMGPKYVPF